MVWSLPLNNGVKKHHHIIISAGALLCSVRATHLILDNQPSDFYAPPTTSRQPGSSWSSCEYPRPQILSPKEESHHLISFWYILKAFISGCWDHRMNINWVYYQHFENHAILSISYNIQYQVSFISECNRISPVCASKHKIASAGNRTRGSCMASRNFTTKPLMLTWLVQDLKIDSHTYIHHHYQLNTLLEHTYLIMFLRIYLEQCSS